MKIREAGLENVELYQVALSNIEGQTTLFVPVAAGKSCAFLASLRRMNGEACDQIQADARRLDSFGLRDIALLKIDVEGHEWEVIEGAITTIQTELPLLHLEIEQRHLGAQDDVRSFADRTARLGYKGFMLREGKAIDCKFFDYDVHQRPYVTAVAANRHMRAYVNNFLFVPKGSRLLQLL